MRGAHIGSLSSDLGRMSDHRSAYAFNLNIEAAHNSVGRVALLPPKKSAFGFNAGRAERDGVSIPRSSLTMILWQSLGNHHAG